MWIPVTIRQSSTRRGNRSCCKTAALSEEVAGKGQNWRAACCHHREQLRECSGRRASGHRHHTSDCMTRNQKHSNAEGKECRCTSAWLNPVSVPSDRAEGSLFDRPVPGCTRWSILERLFNWVKIKLATKKRNDESFLRGSESIEMK